MSDEKPIEELVDKETGLLPKEQHVLDVLFDKYKGNLRAAMDDAGYPKDYPLHRVKSKLKDKILEACRFHLQINSGRAASELVDLLLDPAKPGHRTILAVSKEILDRVGVHTKEEAKPEVRNIFILPPKASQVIRDIEDEEIE